MTDFRPGITSAIVTGAASGIGRATVDLFTASGTSVVAVDLDINELTGYEHSNLVVACAGDVADESTNAEAVAVAEREFGRLDAAIFNAGVRASGEIDTVDLAVFDRSLDVNLRAVVLGMRHAVPALRRAGGGSAVFTASNSGLAGEARRWPYAAAKAGVINLARSLAIDLGPGNIRVNAVCPGPTITGMTQELVTGNPERFEYLRRAVPLQRWASASEVAAAIVWLASPAASFITGVALPVDGGVTASTGQSLPPELSTESCAP